MEDYEIRDVMGRQQHPTIELSFGIEATTQHYSSGIMDREITTQTEYELVITGRNSGHVYARYVNAFIKIPYILSYQAEFDSNEPIEENGELYCEYYQDNTERDVVDVEPNLYRSINKYGPSWFNPILPGLSCIWRIRLSDDFPQIEIQENTIKWSVYADNAAPISGEMPVKNIEVIDLRET
jgi:hypothetical protein